MMLGASSGLALPLLIFYATGCNCCQRKPNNFRIEFLQADLSKPETIPATLVGIHTVIDCATGRPEEPIKTVKSRLEIYK
ncbi:hypothetical protein ACS0TY_006357 [Phlomoides rotata]